MCCYFAPYTGTEYCDEHVCLCVTVWLCVCVCLSVHDDIFCTTRPITHHFLCMLFVAVARSSSGGVVICYVLLFLWMTSYLSAKVGRPRRPAEVQCTRSLGHGCKLCAVILVAGQRMHGTTFQARRVTSQVATPGAESAVYDSVIFCV